MSRHVAHVVPCGAAWAHDNRPVTDDDMNVALPRGEGYLRGRLARWLAVVRDDIVIGIGTESSEQRARCEVACRGRRYPTRDAGAWRGEAHRRWHRSWRPASECRRLRHKRRRPPDAIPAARGALILTTLC